MAITDRLSEELSLRASLDSLRALTCKPGLSDFCSNDYLGFATSGVLREFFDESTPAHQGSTGSRLLSGNSQLAERTEARVAECLKAESALVFGSGYDANVGLFSSLGSRRTTIVVDELSHASVRDGIRLSFGRSVKFKHNDVRDLDEKLRRVDGETIVAVESVYSMDGDVAPLTEILAVCERRGAELIVDEAHSTGVYGEFGEGACVAAGIEKRVFARLHTFGKALGAHGGAVLGNRVLRDYLVNFARSFIYATAPSAAFYGEICAALSALHASGGRRAALWENIKLFSSAMEPVYGANSGVSPIFSIIVPGNSAVKKMAESLVYDGFDVRPILSPTVQEGSERLRISIHAHNTAKEIESLAASLCAAFNANFARAAHE